MRVQILTKKGYEKSKQQLEALSKRKTFLICGFGSIQGLSAWATLYKDFFECMEGRVFFALCLALSAACAIYLLVKLRDTVKIAYNFSMLGFLALLYPKYPDTIFISINISIFIFLFCLTVPAFAIAAIQTKAEHYVKYYENPEKYSSKHKIFIIEKT